MNSILKFFGVWFAATLLAGCVLLFTHGDPSSLNPANEEQRLTQCSDAVGAFSGSSEDDCLAGVEIALERDAQDAMSDLLTWFGVSSLIVLVVGGAFMLKVVARERTAGTRTKFAALRPDWFLYLAVIGVLAVVAGVFAHGDLFGAWAAELDPTRRWVDLTVLVIFWALTFAIGTKLATPEKMQPSIPF